MTRRIGSAPRPSIPLSVWCAAALIAGVALGETLTGASGPGGLGWALGGALGVAVLGAAARGAWRGLPATSAVIALAVAGGLVVGALYWSHVDASARQMAAQGAGHWRVRVISDARQSAFGSNSLVRIGTAAGSPELEVAWPSGGDVPPQGSVAEVWGSVAAPQNSAAVRSLRRAGSAGRMAVRRVGRVTWARGAYGLVSAVRDGARRRIAAVPGIGGALVLSTVLGDRSRLAGTPTETDFQTAGLSHFGAASGFHAVLVVALVGAGLARIVRRRRWRMAVVLAVAATFVMLCGARLSVVRAWAAATLAAVGWDAGRRSDALSALAVVAMAFVCIAPASVFDAGFALSLLGVGGILVFARLGEAWLDEALPRWLRFTSGPCAVTLCAVAATLPVTATAFGEVSLVAPLSNLLAAPFVAALLLLGLLGTLVGTVSIPAGTAVLGAAAAVGASLAALAGELARVPHAAVAVPDAGAALLIAWGLCATATWAVWPKPTRRRARVLLLVASALVVATALGIPLHRGPRIVVMDVGQGDAILIADGDHNFLVDTGPSGGVLRSALGRQGVRKLDGVVLTHYHADHVGGLSGLRGLVQVPVVCVPAGGLAKPSKVLDDARRAAEGGNVEELIAGDRVQVGSVELDVVAPLTPVANPATNEASVVIAARRDGDTVLLTGDAESGVLEGVGRAGLLRHVDVLKVGHHGSAISLDASLLDVLSPSAAVISCGVGNRYHHPRPEPLALLADRGIGVSRTDENGDVMIDLSTSPPTVRRARETRSPSNVSTRARDLGGMAATCAKLRGDPPDPLSDRQERDVRLACRPQVRLPHLRDRGPPAHAGSGAPQGASRPVGGPEFQLRELRG